MSPRRRLVLASASPARLRVLRAAGFSPDVVVSGVSEESEGLEVAVAVVDLARRKAEAVAPLVGDALVIGCDSLLDVDGVGYGKPANAADARAWWREFGGRRAVLRTGHCLIDTHSGRSVARSASTEVEFARPTDAELDAYVATGEPLAVAGGFTLEGRAAPFIRSISGDALNVMGISVALLRDLLGELAVPLADLWPASGPA